MGEESGAVVGLKMFEDAEDGVEEPLATVNRLAQSGTDRGLFSSTKTTVRKALGVAARYAEG